MGSSRRLTGRVVAITGGARGIGEATARALAAAGATVAVGDLDAELAQTSAARYGGLGLPLDVTSPESVAGFLDKVETERGRLDALVNNAGIMVIGRHLDTPLERQLKQIDVNLRGVVLGCHEAARRLSAGGQIVNIASLAGVVATPGTAVYSATKAGVIALSDALDAELAPSGIRVSAVLPSFTATALIEGTTAPRVAPPLEPEQVAAAVVSLLQHYRPRAVVPSSVAFSTVQWPLLPQRARRWLCGRLGLDSAFTDFDHTARAAYDARVGE